MKKEIKFENLINKEFKFYGAAECQFKLDGTTWKAVEDEDDGYRSLLGSIVIPEATVPLFKRPIARVKVVARDNFYDLIDVKDKHVWLTFGTDESDDYYPCFIFHYEPKPPKKGKK